MPVHVNLVFVNDDGITNTACRISGYPDVELIGPTYPSFGTIYSLPQSAGRTQAATSGRSFEGRAECA
jgi:hypothetical protein